MTSLAKQLQRLAVPHTQVVLGEDRWRASLLFDAKEAASIDKETFHALGLNGLEELETINPVFHEFIGSLFGDSALTFERSVQTKEVNEKLDAKVRRFLIHLSPYCLLKPAQKALEWLIHRYHIHLYNVDDLLMCFLPYHESKIFIRVLQLLKFDNKIASKWDWLQPLQKAGVPLSRQTLVNHCRTNPAFLAFICNIIPTTVKVHQESETETPKCRVLFSFYATTLTSVIDSGSVSEEFMAVILPHLSRGMKSTVPEYKAASYMILAQLLHSAKLKFDILRTVQQIIAKSLSPGLLSEGLACLLLMFQNQDMSYTKLSKRSFKHLSRHVGIVDTLAQLAEQFDVTEFLSCFLDKLVPAAFKLAVGMATSGESGASSSAESEGSSQQYMSLLHRLLLNVKLTDSMAEQVALKFLELYVGQGSKSVDEDIDSLLRDSLQGIVRQLEGRYSSCVDNAIKIMMSHADEEEQDLIKNFLNEFVLSVPHQLIADSDAGLVLSLNHRLPEVRQTAVQTLIRNRDEVEDGEFFRDSVLTRLKDDDPKVVTAVIQLGKELWSVIEDDLVTIHLLVDSIYRGLSDFKWESVARVAVKILGEYEGEKTQDLLTSLLPIFFLREASKFQLDIIHKLLTSTMMTTLAFTEKLAAEHRVAGLKLKSGRIDLGEVNVAICRCFATALCKISLEEGLSMVKSWTKAAIQNRSLEMSCLLLIMLDCLVTMVTKPTTEMKYSLLQAELTQILMKQEFGIYYDGTNLSQLTLSWKELIFEKRDILANHMIPFSFWAKAVHTLVDVLQVPTGLEESLYWQLKGDNSCEDMFIQLYVSAYALLLDRASTDNDSAVVFRQMLLMFEKKFPDSSSYIKFHCLLWTQHANNLAHDLHLNPVIQARSLKLGHAIIQSMTGEQLKPVVETVSVNLLLVLTSQHSPVRSLAIDIAMELPSKVEGQDCCFKPLLKKVVHCSEELRADPQFVQQMIASFFKHTTAGRIESSRRSPRKNRRKSGEEKPLDNKSECLRGLIGQIVSQSTPLFVQKQLLHIFALLEDKEILTSLLPLMERLMNQDHGSQSKMATDCLTALLQRFSPETKDILEPSSPGLELFIKALKSQDTSTVVEESYLTQKQAIEQVSKELYSVLEPASQQMILSCLFDVCLHTDSLEIANMVRRCLKHLPLDGCHVETELKTCLKSRTAGTVREAKRLKQTTGEVPPDQTKDEFSSRDWQRAVIVLESVQNKKKILNYTVLVPVCFQLIARILECDSHNEAEYIKQTILTLLYNLCGRMQKDWEDTKDAVVPERQFNMELIVNTIRSSENPQTHHQALLVLTAAAKIYPEHLLHNMMSVFTFMGANIMRQDDAYSFHIISKILETVIPALITACEQRKRVPKGITNDLDDIITMVMQVFVDSYSHIPEHRRHLLFSKLLMVIGEENYLWRMLSLMMGLVVTKGTLKAELTADSQESDPSIRDVEFCLGLCAQVPVSVQLISARKMLEYQLGLPDDKDEEEPQKRKSIPQSLDKLKKEDVAIFSIASHSAKQLRHFKYATVHLLVSLFSGQDFMVQMSENEDETMLEHFQSLLETLLQLITHVTSVANTSADKPTAKFWRALQHKVHDLLDKLVSLLPDQSFIDVIGGLVSHDLPSIQRKALELLNTKLQQQKEISEGDGSELLPLVSQLQDLIKAQTKAKTMTEEGSMNSHAAFISLKLLCRHIGQQHTESFVKVLKTAVGVFTGSHGNVHVSSCALLCIAEICNTLKVHVIQHLSSFMPPLLKIMTDQDQLLQHELYILSVVTTVNKVVENLAHFLSPYLQDIVINICILSSSTDDIVQKPQVQMRLKTIRTTLSTALPTRVLLPTVMSCFQKLITQNMSAISCLMSLFGDHIAHIGREDLLSHINQLQMFFMTCLSVRIDYPEEKKSVICELEGVTIDTIISMVMKLSEATFKPFLYKIFDWATSDDDQRERILVFYRLAESLAEKLRSLFTLFAGHIINHAARMLDENNISKKKKPKFFSTDRRKRKQSCLLLQYILDCLYKTFLYDTEGFVNKERFDMIMQPLVDQLDNIQGSEEMYRERVDEHLVRCIVQLTIASQDDSLWRPINYQICLKTRSSEPQVKESALKVLDELHKRLGEDYMPLLPDTVPFLAELMEDESEEVEKKCQSVIREMEKTLGEPLQKYF